MKRPPRKSKKKVTWSGAEVKLLRALAGRKSSKQIARQLKRTEAAVRFKAWQKRIRLAVKG